MVLLVFTHGPFGIRFRRPTGPFYYIYICIYSPFDRYTHICSLAVVVRAVVIVHGAVVIVIAAVAVVVVVVVGVAVGAVVSW